MTTESKELKQKHSISALPSMKMLRENDPLSKAILWHKLGKLRLS